MTSSCRGLSRRLNGSMRDPLGRRAGGRRRRRDHAEPARQRLEGARPVVLGAEQQSDEVVGRGGHGASSMGRSARSAAGGARAGGATTASRGRRRSPTGRARSGFPSPAAGRPCAGSTAATRSGGPPTAPWPHDEQDRQPRRAASRDGRRAGWRRSRSGWRSRSRRPAHPSRARCDGRSCRTSPMRQREQVGALQGEVHRVVGAEADSRRVITLGARRSCRRSTARPGRTSQAW